MLKKIWNWLAWSSADPSKVALTVKGFLGTAGAAIVLVSPLVHLHVGTQQVTDITDVTSQIVVAFFGVISAIVTLAALVRKFILMIESYHQQA